MQDLERHGALVPKILSPVHRPHPAATQLVLDAITVRKRSGQVLDPGGVHGFAARFIGRRNGCGTATEREATCTPVAKAFKVSVKS